MGYRCTDLSQKGKSQDLFDLRFFPSKVIEYRNPVLCETDLKLKNV
jgi:hypothetical protein